MLERLVCVGGRRAVRECNVQEQDLHGDGEQRLDEQRGAEVRAEPVEDPGFVSGRLCMCGARCT